MLPLQEDMPAKKCVQTAVIQRLFASLLAQP